MIESDPKRLHADRRKFPKVHRVLAQYPCINALIEVDTALYRHFRTLAQQLGAWHETEVTDFGNDLLETR